MVERREMSIAEIAMTCPKCGKKLELLSFDPITGAERCRFCNWGDFSNQGATQHLGCMFGLAIGDALGAPVEFMSWASIQKEFGSSGVAGLGKHGRYTDDTQMSLATAQALIEIQSTPLPCDIANTYIVHRHYLKWLATQSDARQNRSPGRTCISALQSGRIGSIAIPINNSKGCGGVMRTAPVGLAFSNGELAFQQGAEYAAITHGHPSGYLPAGFLSEIIFHLSRETNSLKEAIQKTRTTILKYKGHEETIKLVDRALKYSASDLPIGNAIEALGSGWTGDEALAISLLCALRYPTDWKAAVLAAVNHSGDSDSTGSIAGAILGTLLGVGRIPQGWILAVENSTLIKETAKALHAAFSELRLLSNYGYTFEGNRDNSCRLADLMRAPFVEREELFSIYPFMQQVLQWARENEDYINSDLGRLARTAVTFLFPYYRAANWGDGDLRELNLTTQDWEIIGSVIGWKPETTADYLNLLLQGNREIHIRDMNFDFFKNYIVGHSLGCGTILIEG
jgi:ADP-ribosylglycohydrolase